jgi:diguanylate cyclase (GGDEF)-like protein
MPHRRTSLNMLIVDHDRVSALILRKVLGQTGHAITTAPDGLAALEQLEREVFQVVITDWTMPNLDGLELCRRIRQGVDQVMYIYVIVLSARSCRDDRLAAYAAGADDFLAKPVDRGELIARIEVARRIIHVQQEMRRRSRELEVMHDELKRHCTILTEAAIIDGLTGLKNRRHFREVLESGFSFVSRQKLPISLVMVDVDHFKNYNDSFGHPACDDALTEIGRILRDNARDHDVVARYGGEEFVLLLSATDSRGARLVSERLRTKIESGHWPKRSITASSGVATASPITASTLQLVDEADRALCHSKRSGRNCVTHFEDALSIGI